MNGNVTVVPSEFRKAPDRPLEVLPEPIAYCAYWPTGVAVGDATVPVMLKVVLLPWQMKRAFGSSITCAVTAPVASEPGQ